MFQPVATFLKMTAASFGSLISIINVDYHTTIRLLSSWLSAGFIVVDKLIPVNSVHSNFLEKWYSVALPLSPGFSTSGPDSRTTLCSFPRTAER